MQSNRRGVSKTISAAAMILVGLFVGGVFYVGYASADTPATLQVQAFPSQIQSGDTAQIQVQIQHATPSTSYSVTITVTPPTSPVRGGGPFCVTEFVATDGGGNAQVPVSYPDTGDPSALFLASSCSPAGTGGPTTYVAGTYTVEATAVPPTALDLTPSPASTSFTVQAPQHEVTGTGTASSQTTVTLFFIPATGCTTGTGTTCVESCSGPTFTAATNPSTTSTPSETAAPFLYTAVGSQELTGVITSNTPATRQANNVVSPCGVTGSTIFNGVSTVVDTYSSVTINAPGDNPVTGGLIVTESASYTTTGTPGVLVTTVSTAHLTYEGTGPLRGVTGVGEAIASSVTTGTTTISTAEYWVQLTNVPGY